MSAKILSGTEAAQALLESLKPLVKKLDPRLVIIQLGNDAASSTYIRKKLEACEQIGMRSEHRHLPEQTSLAELESVIDSVNDDPDVTGFILQFPLPDHLEAHVSTLVRRFDAKKDMDGFTVYNLGKILISKELEHLPPATPAGIIALLEHYKISVAGKHAVIVGRSKVVGKPLALMLLNRDATVTVCHSKTPDLAAMTTQADILISATGIAGLITKNMVKKGAVVIDVGMNYTDDRLVGDIDFEEVSKVASAITPVPGGVGPMTVAALIRNCVKAKKTN